VTRPQPAPMAGGRRAGRSRAVAASRQPGASRGAGLTGLWPEPDWRGPERLRRAGTAPHYAAQATHLSSADRPAAPSSCIRAGTGHSRRLIWRSGPVDRVVLRLAIAWERSMSACEFVRVAAAAARKRTADRLSPRLALRSTWETWMAPGDCERQACRHRRDL
jgi:hypothetical protein